MSRRLVFAFFGVSCFENIKIVKYLIVRKNEMIIWITFHVKIAKCTINYPSEIFSSVDASHPALALRDKTFML